VPAFFPNPHPELTLFRLCLWALGYAIRRFGALATVALSLLLKVGLDVLKPWPMVFLLDYILGKKVMPATLAGLIERIPGSHDAMALAGWTVAATVAIFLGSWAIGLVASYGNINLGQRMTYDLAGDLFAKLQQLPLHFHARKSVGDNIRRVTGDCTCASVIVKDALLPVFSSVISLVAMFMILWRLDSMLALLALVIVPYMMWVFKRYAGPMMELSYQQQEAEGELYTVVEQTFSAIPVVQAFCREELNDRWLRRTTSEALSATLALTKIQLRFKILMGLATALGTAAVLWFGAQHTLAGALSIGTIILFLSYLGSLYAPLEAIMYTSSTIQAAAGSARRVWEVLSTPNIVAEKPGAPALGAVRGEIRFEEVSVGYEENRPVLKNISLHVPVGEMLALVGATGAGKTTLVSLIPRFFDPWDGRVLVDGVDVREVSLNSLRRQIAIVLQEPFLFPISIAENIAYGRRDAGMQQIEEAARAANAHEFIKGMPQGYGTVIGERGATLSGGERQRLSIARALLKNAPILILDEPTSALDAETEHSLMEAVERLTKGRTTFIIAHRLSTVRRASRIIVLKDGAVIESGTHAQLLNQNGDYAQYYRLQSGVT
jgi:ATP-binding cassette subfamily B protein/subfamily B ATP-binding cassette protein MsbA